MSTLFLHVGLHKTGTTAVQKFMYDNRPVLARQGVLYPSTGLLADDSASWGHHDLAYSIRDDRPIWEPLRREIDGTGRVVMSSEAFVYISRPPTYRAIQRELPGWTIRPICYVRRQDELLESTYNYHVKALGETMPIMEFANRIARRLAFRKVIDPLGRVFGPENVIVRVYSREEIVGSIYEDFLSCIGLGASSGNYAFPEKTINPGLTREGVDLMREANRRYAGKDHALKRVRADIISQHQAPPFSPHCILTDEERRDLMEEYRPMNNFVARNYLGRRHLFP